MAFHQQGWTVTNVYNVNGDLVLTAQSTHADLAALIADLRTRVGGLEDVPAEDLASLDEEFPGEDAPEAETPGRLTRIAGRLRTLNSASTSAVELARTLETAAEWAGHHIT
ncbi:hypothetical protein [Actinocorallia longicatena]|uniref:Uncharacterized protein n=1 Tax=Actinocorallia longicatena TaxID=111803 RepID=A0ABP6Q218_9ACTN